MGLAVCATQLDDVLIRCQIAFDTDMQICSVRYTCVTGRRSVKVGHTQDVVDVFLLQAQHASQKQHVT